MGRLVIKFTQMKNQVFDLDAEGRYVLGRGEDCDVVLPNVSVSREHAAVAVANGETILEDLGSANGTIVNGETVERHALVRGDEVQIGKFSMVYLGSGREDRFYKGRYVAYLPQYDPRTVVPDDDAATFAMSVEALKAIQRSNRAVEQARVVSELNPDKYWYPEERGLTFGGGGLVPVKGWFVWGVPAEISWDGSAHVLTMKAVLTRVTVNGVAVSERGLRGGDRVQVGSSVFRYERPDK